MYCSILLRVLYKRTVHCFTVAVIIIHSFAFCGVVASLLFSGSECLVLFCFPFFFWSAFPWPFRFEKSSLQEVVGTHDRVCLLGVRRNAIENRAISIFDGQKPCNRIPLSIKAVTSGNTKTHFPWELEKIDFKIQINCAHVKLHHHCHFTSTFKCLI